MKNKIKTEECCYCKWYWQDEDDNFNPIAVCDATNNSNLKGFPFRNKLKCFELNTNLYELEGINE